jgi:hypothetical protein
MASICAWITKGADVALSRLCLGFGQHLPESLTPEADRPYPGSSKAPHFTHSGKLDDFLKADDGTRSPSGDMNEPEHLLPDRSCSAHIFVHDANLTLPLLTCMEDAAMLPNSEWG